MHAMDSFKFFFFVYQLRFLPEHNDHRNRTGTQILERLVGH